MGLLDRDRSVLVVVDLQPGFLARDWLGGLDRAAADSALARAAWLAVLAARLGIPIVATEEEPERHGATALQLPDGTPLLRKPTFGLTRTPEILEAVRATGRRSAVLVGCETDVCVAQSAVGLADEGFDCTVVEDATFSPGEMHERGLARLASAGVARNHAKGVAYEWLASVDDAHEVLPSLPAPPFRLF